MKVPGRREYSQLPKRRVGRTSVIISDSGHCPTYYYYSSKSTVVIKLNALGSSDYVASNDGVIMTKRACERKLS